MFEPEEEFSAVLSDDQIRPIGPSDSSREILSDSSREDTQESDDIPIRQLSQMQLTWIRFRRHKFAMFGAVIVLFFVIIAIIGPWISPETYNGFDPSKVGITQTGMPPILSYRYLMGTDQTGHAIMMWVILGTRISLEVGIFGALLASVLGVLVGAISGYFGGWVDAVCMRITDVFLTLPFLPLLILLAAYIGSGHVYVIVGIFGFLGWSATARLIRSYYLTFREQEFTEAARAVGVSSPRIIFRHILPNALSPVIVSFTLAVAAFISGEAAVDFLGVGIHTPDTSWGLALAGAQNELIVGNWWWALFPGLCLLLMVLAINFLGDGLRDALDVRAKVATE